MLNRYLVAFIAIACTGCAQNSEYERIGIPVVDKSTRIDAATMIAAMQPIAPPKTVEAPPEPASVFVPAQPKPLEQKVTFVSDSDEWAKQQESKAPKKPIKHIITDADLDARIVELQGKYQKGDVDAAYQLVGLLLKRKRVEEAETALDYAARQRHVPSMLLYGRYFEKIGDKGMAKKWLQAASESGSKEASEELKSI